MKNFTYHTQHIPIKWFNKNNGLDSGQVHNICQDNDGLIWLSGPTGLSRYNGNVLENFTKRLKLSSHGLRKVIAGTDGQLLIATDCGIDSYVNGITQQIVEDWEFGLVNDLAYHTVHELIFSSSDGLFKYFDGSIRKIFTDIHDLVFIDQAGLIWTNSRSNGLKICDAEFKSLHLDISDQIQSLKYISQDLEGFICLVTNEHLIEISNYEIIRKTPFNNVTAALRRNNELWLGINSQLIRYTLLDNQWVKPAIINHDCYINNFFTDSFNNIWCATAQYGAIKISALKELIYQPVFDQPSSVFCINQVDAKHCLIGGRKINKIMSTENFHFYLDVTKPDNLIIWDQIQIDEQLQFAATDVGVFACRQGQWQPLFENDKYLFKQARIFFRRQNQLWIGTRYGLTETRIDGEGNLHIVKQFDLGYVYSISCDAQDQLWIGTIGNGLFIESNHDFINHKLRHVKNNANVYCISFNEQNCCALLHDNLITIHHENQESQLLIETESLISGWSVVWDEDTIWVGGVNGLSQYDTKQRHEIRNITAFLSQANWEFTTSKSLLMVDNRYLYCGLNSGFAVVDKYKLDDIPNTLCTYLDEVIWEKADLRKVKQLDTVKPGNWTIKIKFYSAWFYNENNLKYRYKLIGFDDDWQITKQNYVQFNSLRLGHYEFLIQAFSPLKGWSESTVLYEFEVQTPLWARGWLKSIYGVFDVFYAVFSSKRRNSALLQMNDHLEKQLNQKNLEITDAFTELRETNLQLHKEANADPLTGMANRRSFQKSLNIELDISTRSNSPLSLLILDIDDFKAFNDNYGHDVGDLVLINVSHVLEETIRKGDYAARIGGEEFAIILPHTSLDGAKKIASKILNKIAEIKTHSISELIKETITLSIGIGLLADNNWKNADSEELIKQADQGLYLAKNNGKNQYSTIAVDQ